MLNGRHSVNIKYIKYEEPTDEIIQLSSDKVVWYAPGDLGLALPRGRIKLLEEILHVLINLQDRRLIPAPIAVVGGGEYGDDIPIMAPAISLHDELMGAGDEGEVVAVVEGFRDVLAKGVAGAARAHAPAGAFVRVGPEEIAHWAFVWDLLDSTQLSHLIQSLQLRGQATMQTEYLKKLSINSIE